MPDHNPDKFLTLMSVSVILVLAVFLAAKSKPEELIQKPQPQTPQTGETVFESTPATGNAATSTATSTKALRLNQYFEVVGSCGPYWEGEPCVNMRSGPGLNYPVIRRLRNGTVLKIASTTERDGLAWYKVGFDGGLRYIDRVDSGWYVAAGDYLRLFENSGESISRAGINASSTKRIVVDRKKEMLYAYDGGTLFMEQSVSVGLADTPTPRGTFWVYRKIPDAYMQGPIPGITDQYYDLPGVPWDLYFTFDGGAIHGAYWHANFGEPWSHGCVNLPPDQAEILYKWAELGTPVTVID